MHSTRNSDSTRAMHSMFSSYARKTTCYFEQKKLLLCHLYFQGGNHNRDYWRLRIILNELELLSAFCIDKFILDPLPPLYCFSVYFACTSVDFLFYPVVQLMVVLFSG